MDAGGYTAAGPREVNEDSFYFADFSRKTPFTNGVVSFLMVSDGMGGYQGGDVASALATSCAERYIAQLIEMANGGTLDLDAAYALGEISQTAHDAIRREMHQRGNASMGATFIGAFASTVHAWIGHVGDSRAYLIHDGKAKRITEDHSQVGRMLSRGLITEEEAQKHPDRNRIERALGFTDAVPEITEVDLCPGDALLLCSDGVYTALNCDDIAECVLSAVDAQAAAVEVVERAFRKGADDNSTVVLALNKNPTQASSTNRMRQPTMRMEIGSRPKHASVQQRRAQGSHGRSRTEADSRESNRAAQHVHGSRPSVSQRRSASSSSSAPKRAIPILLIVAAIAIAVFVFVALMGGNQGVASANEQGGQVEFAVEASSHADLAKCLAAHPFAESLRFDPAEALRAR